MEGALCQPQQSFLPSRAPITCRRAQRGGVIGAALGGKRQVVIFSRFRDRGVSATPMPKTSLSMAPTAGASCPQQRTRIEDLSGLAVVTVVGTDVHVGATRPLPRRKKVSKGLLVPFGHPDVYVRANQKGQTMTCCRVRISTPDITARLRRKGPLD